MNRTPKLPFVLDVDASQTAIGACLHQWQDGAKVPLAFCSKTLGPARQNYCTTKRELYACIYAMRYFRGFISGEDITICTDHAMLKRLVNFQCTDAMYGRWIVEMASYEPYKLQMRPGHEHRNADGMS